MKSSLAHALLCSSILAGGFLLVHGAGVAPAQADPCTATTVVNTADSTTCTGGTSDAGLTYVAAPYVAGDFTLTLDNHDVIGLPAGQHGIGFTGVTAGDDGTIILRNGSDVTSGTGANGIYAQPTNAGTTINITLEDTSSVTGALSGIDAESNGGKITVAIGAGAVTGNAGDGIRARAVNADVEVTTGAGSDVTGLSGNGISAFASAGGNAVVKAQGTVTGSQTGIDAEALDDGNTVLVETAAAVTGQGNNGIDAAANAGVTVKAGGDVTGESGSGISAVSFQGEVRVTTAAGTTESGTLDGITANVTGGTVVIGAEGTVTGRFSGIDAHAEAGTVGITTGAQAVSGTEVDGIQATAAGAITVATGGNVSGGESGIDVRSGATDEPSAGGNVSVTTSGAAGTTVTGSSSAGIYASTIGTSTITITNTVITQGFTTGIRAASLGGAIQITNDGVVRNLSGEGDDRAITALGGPATIDNNGDLIGSVLLSTAKDTLNNNGLWFIAGGINDFGGEYDGDTVNNTGVIMTADNPAVGALTIIDNLEVFNNSGVVSLVDGGELVDTLVLAALPGDIQYVGQGGVIAVDGLLAADPIARADFVDIQGSSAGITYIRVNLLDPNGSTPNFDGIPVIDVRGGTEEGHFQVEGGVLNAGFFAWEIQLDEDGRTHELVTTGLGAGAHEFAAGITGAQDFWHQTAGALLERQADLRPLIAAALVTPVADFAEPVAPTPVSRVTPGFWFKGVGAWLERDDEEGVLILDREQTIWGGLAGFDFGSENVVAPGDALMLGLFGGYLTSDLDFKSTGTEWDYEGPAIGAYATYLDHAFYVDALVKVDFLDVDIDAEDIAPAADNVDTDVLNIGGRIDMGYKIGLEHGLFVEPQAALAVVHTEVDDIDGIFAGAVDFEDETSVRGRLGLRLGHEHTADNGIIYSGDVTAGVWQEFAGDNHATVFAPQMPVTDLADDPGGTFGDVSLGFGMLSPEGWSGFVRGKYAFAEDYDAITGNAGLRYAW